MTKSPEKKKTVYKSFEQFKAELFPDSHRRAEARSSQDVHNLAICLAEASFNKVLRHEKEA